MGTWESNGHVPLKGQSRDPNTLRGQYLKSARDRGIVIKSLSLTVSEIFRPKHHVLIDTMLNRHCACAISRDMYPLCKI